MNLKLTIRLKSNYVIYFNKQLQQSRERRGGRGGRKMVEEHKRCLDGSGLWWRKEIRIGGAACSTPESTRILRIPGLSPATVCGSTPAPSTPASSISFFRHLFHGKFYIIQGERSGYSEPPLYNCVTPPCDIQFFS